MSHKAMQAMLDVMGDRTFITRADLIAAGFSPSNIAKRLHDNRLTPLVSNAYLIGSNPQHSTDALFGLKAHALLRVTHQNQPQHLYVSHFAALHLHGLPLMREARTLDLISTGKGHKRGDGVRIHSYKTPRNLTTHAGMRLATPQDATIDAMRTLQRISSLVVILDAYTKHTAGPKIAAFGDSPGLNTVVTGIIGDLTTRAKAMHVRLPPAFREAVTLMHPQSQSPMESVGRAALWRAGLAGFRPQCAVQTLGGTIYPDLADPELKLAIEFDGAVKYADRPHAALMAERAREKLLLNEGWGLLRFTWRDVLEPEALVAAVRKVLARAARR